MKHMLAVCILVSASGATAQERDTRLQRAASQLDVADYEGREVVAGELLVKFRDGNSQKLRGDGARLRRYRVTETRELGRSGYSHLRLTDHGAMRETIAQLALDSDVEYVEPNYIVEASATPNDPQFIRQWALKNTGQDGGLVKADIDAAAAWEYSKGSKSTVVGVVDTGVDYTHPDLKDNIWSAPKAFTVTFGPGDSITCPIGSHGYNAVKNSCDPQDNAQHGTWVSGTLGAAGNNGAGIAGVAWNTSIMGLAFIDSTNRGSVSNAIRAIEFAIQARKALGDGANIRILNNSWGGAGFSQALLDEINKAGSAGMLFVVAAGNTPKNLDNAPDYPAAYNAPNMISLAATDNKDALATFSAWGATTVQAGAPGVGIATTSPGGLYATVSGTSFSTPITSGIAALVLSACSGLDTAALRKTILDNVDPDPALAGKTSTGGRVNAYKPVRACTSAQVKPGFALTAAPLSVSLNPGANAVITLQLTASGGFSGPVQLAVTGLPAGVTGTFAPATLTAGQTARLTVTAAANAVPLTAAVNASIKAVSGTLANIAVLSVNVKPVPTFNFTASPPAATMIVGGSTAFTFDLTPVGDFNQTIYLQISGMPAGTSGQLTQTAPGKLILTVKSTTAAAPKVYTLNASAVSGSITKNAPLTLTINSK